MEQAHNSLSPADRSPSRLRKLLMYSMLSVGAIVSVFAVIFLSHPDPFISTLLNAQITEAFHRAYPAYSIRIAAIHCRIWENRLDGDSIMVQARDSTLQSFVAEFTIRKVSWFQLLLADGRSSMPLSSSVIEASDIHVMFPVSQYELRCGRLRISVPDSEMVAEALELNPLVDDQHLFAQSKFRQTRFHFTTRQCKASGVAYLQALDHGNYRVRSVHLHDVYLDVLINKNKRAMSTASTPRVSGETFFSIHETLQCDSLAIINGALKYAEQFEIGRRPAVIAFDSMQVSAERIASRSGSRGTVVIRAKGEFMKAGKTTMFMSLPVSSPAFSLQYSGSLQAMDLRSLNPFIEVAEQQRVTSGTLETATFDIDVLAGHSTGRVRAVYRDLTLAAINKHTGSENGFLDGITSYLAKTYRIRGTNVPGKSGAMKIGEVKYERQRDDPFFRCVWFALRSGVGDVVGF